MSSNFPSAYDTLVELGGPFVNVAPPVDPLRNLDAVKLNNTNDSLLAVEARIGRLGETNSGTIDWATLTVAGSPSQGLRFAGGHAAWPGLILENGLFIDSANNHVCFHQTGDPLGTFTDLTIGGGGGGTWDDLYAAANTMAIDTVGRALTWTSSIPGLAFCVERTVAFVTQTSPLVRLLESGIDDSNQPKPLLSVEGGCVHLDYRGVTNLNQPVLELWREHVGKFVHFHTGTAAAPVADIFSIDNYGQLELQALTGASTLLTVGHAGSPRFTFYADGRLHTIADSVNAALSVQQDNAGTYIAQFNNLSDTRWQLREDGTLNHFADTSFGLAASTVTQSGAGLLLLLNVPFLRGTKPRWRFYNDGSTGNTAESPDPCLILQQDSTGNLLQLIDGSGPTTRMTVGLDGSMLMNTTSTGGVYALSIQQSGADFLLLTNVRSGFDALIIDSSGLATFRGRCASPGAVVTITQDSSGGYLNFIKSVGGYAWQFKNDGSTLCFADSATQPALSISQDGAAELLELVDGPGRATRLSVELSGKASLLGSATIGSALLQLTQVANPREPFVNYVGTETANYSNNLSSVNGDGVVTGPKNKSASPGWTFAKMVLVSVNGVDYWMPVYTPNP
jgi:hypothetical protein